MSAIPHSYSAEERAERVRAILSHPPTASHATVMRLTGISRETVRRVRFGMLWADVLPELERMPRDVGRLQCNCCVHWDKARDHHGDVGRCGLGIPEPSTEGLSWARGCGAFTQAR